MKISGSIFSTDGDYIEYARQLKKAGINYLHIDIFQNSDIFTIKDLYQFNKPTFLPLDIHLIYEHLTEEDIEILNKVKATYLNIQFENLKEKKEIKNIAKKFNGQTGIAITAETPLDIIDEYLNDISQVLVMCSIPGVSGAPFNDSNYERVNLIHKKYPSLKIVVDGGINKYTGKKMGELGADILVSGSFLCKDISSLARNGYYLKYMDEQNINVRRNMLSFNELPLVTSRESFVNIIICMNQYRLGIVFVVDGQKLLGVISDGDIRRNLLKYNEKIFKKTAFELINKTPFVVDAEAHMEDVYDSLFKNHKGIDVIPIIDENRLIGAIDLHIGK